MNMAALQKQTHLVSARARLEVAIAQIELLDAQRAHLLLLILINKLILLYPRHHRTCVIYRRALVESRWMRVVLMVHAKFAPGVVAREK